MTTERETLISRAEKWLKSHDSQMGHNGQVIILAEVVRDLVASVRELERDNKAMRDNGGSVLPSPDPDPVLAAALDECIRLKADLKLAQGQNFMLATQMSEASKEAEAAEATVRALTEERDEWMHTAEANRAGVSNLRRGVEALQAEVARLKDYAQHKDGCDAGLCNRCGMSKNNPYHPKDHTFIDSGCTCGLTPAEEKA